MFKIIDKIFLLNYIINDFFLMFNLVNKITMKNFNIKKFKHIIEVIFLHAICWFCHILWFKKDKHFICFYSFKWIIFVYIYIK